MDALLAPLAFINSTFGWLVLLFLALLLFGSRLPKVARNLGQGINEFKKGLNDRVDGADADADTDADAPPRREPEASRTRKSHIDDTSV